MSDITEYVDSSFARIRPEKLDRFKALVERLDANVKRRVDGEDEEVTLYGFYSDHGGGLQIGVDEDEDADSDWDVDEEEEVIRILPEIASMLEDGYAMNIKHILYEYNFIGGFNAFEGNSVMVYSDGTWYFDSLDTEPKKGWKVK
jgi:hypothetical protein